MNSSYKPQLTLWRDLTPLPQPLIRASSRSKHVLVVGGGVTGLVNSWVLLDKGYRVTVVSKEWASFGQKQRLASQIAGALWEYPPAVCGQHTDKISLQHSKKWCMVAYHIWNGIASDPQLSQDAGVRMMPSNFYFPNPIEEDDFQLSKMKEIMASGVVGFNRGIDLVSEHNVDPVHGGVDAYGIMAPVIDTDTAMAWLMDLVKSKGAEMITETIRGDLLMQEHQLRERFGADIILNCTGIASAETAGDESCYPIRGGLFRVINDGVNFPKVNAALTISADVARHNEIVFIVPRTDNVLLLGGFTEPNNWNLDLTLDSPVMKRMKARCEEFLPALKNARLDPVYPMAQGLRPFRQGNIRVERELRPSSYGTKPSRIVHSYGHGGAGWSLSFGCAGDVLHLVEEALLDLPPRVTTSRAPPRQHAMTEIQARM
ncbi:FAD dependent oxidoreductase [Marasmius fiardii PR-910]|nr:FAD dependent oxidoreductase [Marasmius fiardii PR-910]